MGDVRVPLVVCFPAGTAPEVITDRIYLLAQGALTLPQAGVVVESWDTRGVTEAVA